MKTHVCQCARVEKRALRIALVVLAAVAGLGLVQGVFASDSAPNIVRVEEDWELVVDTPDANNVAPQVTCAISPTGQLNSLYATIEFNHQSQPDFVAGGMQLQLWNGESPVSTHKYPNNAVMSQPGETVSWTQAMTLTGGNLVYSVVNGESVTWGSFGWACLHVSAASDLPNLNGYDANVSVQNSGVGFASNRVQSLVLKAVRLVTSTGEVLADTTLRPVYPRS